MQQGEFEKKEQLELHTDEYIANFDFFVNCSEQPKEWLDWLKVLGLSVIDAKRIDEELALLPDREIANAELAALSLKSVKFYIPTDSILNEVIIQPPSCYEDNIRLCVLRRVLISGKFDNSYNEVQITQNANIRDKLTEINRFLGYQPADQKKYEALRDTDGVAQRPIKRARVSPVFSSYIDLRANEIALVMMENKTVKMVIRGKSINVNPDELGLKVGLQEWKLLEGASFSQGDLTSTLKKLNSTSNLEDEKTKIKTAVSRLRKSLIYAMNLKDSPINYMKGNGYKFTFKAMTHELLNGGNVKKGRDAMDYVNDDHFEESEYGSDDFGSYNE